MVIGKQANQEQVLESPIFRYSDQRQSHKLTGELISALSWSLHVTGTSDLRCGARISRSNFMMLYGLNEKRACPKVSYLRS